MKMEYNPNAKLSLNISYEEPTCTLNQILQENFCISLQISFILHDSPNFRKGVYRFFQRFREILRKIPVLDAECKIDL